ncbi:hypothetical protein KIH77_09865 [Bifidobacterium sp. 82T24]|uniref:Spy0128 family protein n=1 Tax=Bifidobacterium pluvialisilvae TaxID=2834436 RepID=UPI001C589582|nr:FctA domain-containing protein [Bifidobacterium pluvialisilvae]MBW3089024.1 hypothetical protein [Bifidobacterium pluvialisilvae]
MKQHDNPKRKGGIVARVAAALSALAVLGTMAVTGTAVAATANEAPTAETTSTTPAQTPDAETKGTTDAATNNGAAKDSATSGTNGSSTPTNGTTNEATPSPSPTPDKQVRAVPAPATTLAARAAGNCSYATDDSGLKHVCWLDMSGFNQNEAEYGGQQMTVPLAGGLSLSFTATYSSPKGRDVVAAAAPVWDDENGHSVFGEELYPGVGGKPVLYQKSGDSAYNATSTITLTNVQLLRNGARVTDSDYSLILGDGESTAVGESISYGSSAPLTQLAQYPASAGNGWGLCTPSGVGSTSVTCTGNGEDKNTLMGIRLYQTNNPTEVSITLKDNDPGSRQGAVFGVMFASALTTVSVDNNANNAFTAKVEETNNQQNQESTQASAGETTTSGTLAILAKGNESKDVTFTLSGVSNWDNYDVTFSCDGACSNNPPKAQLQNGVYTATTSVKPNESVHGTWVVTPKTMKIDVKKEWADGATKANSVTVSLNSCTDKTYATCQPTGQTKTLQADGWTASFTDLKAGYYQVVETAVDGDASKVKEYKVTYSPDGGHADLSGYKDATVTITNAPASVTLPAAEFFKARAVIVGREWKTNPADSFTYVLNGKASVTGKSRAAGDCQPMPADYNIPECNTSIIVTDKNAHSFGDITYSEAGTYTYRINESAQVNHDITRSQAVYQVVVTVATGTDGNLTATAKVSQVNDDNGTVVSPAKLMADKTGVFTHYLLLSALPVTGGTTGRAWLIASGVMLALAGAAYTVWRRTRMEV